MKKILLILILLLPVIGICQTKSFENSTIDHYKYFVVETTTYKNSKKIILRELKKAGYNVLDVNNVFPKDLKNNPNLALYVSSIESCGAATCDATFYLQTLNRQTFYQYGWKGSLSSGNAVKKAMKGMLKYKHKYKAPVIKSSNINIDIDLKSEKSIRDYFDSNGTDLIEGIWEYTSTGTGSYRLAIIKNDYKFSAIILEKTGPWNPGDQKANFETAATDEIVTINWIMGDKRTNKKIVGTVTNNALIDFNLGNNISAQLYKVYPKLGKKKKTKTGEWAGNGSGLIISKSGYIVTNHHVIEDADDIEVEFIIDGDVKKFNAEIVQSDKTNDLAIIKIFDMNFDGLEDLPYNFKTRSSDVGTKVYAYGYPMALSLMGKEIKITDGIISSKSGFDGDITTYQITAPIQGGNSGGPLFDEKGNFLGINSSGLRKDIADNVGYSIKSSYVLNLIDVLPKSIELPSNTKLQSLPLTEQIKEISKYVVLVKVK